MKSIIGVALLLLAMHAELLCGQEKINTDHTLAGSIEAQNFTFIARFILPLNGAQRNLTGVDYTVVVKPGIIECYLPYIGVAYTAPMDPREGGLKFTSKEFDYTLQHRKKGRIELTIRPKDVRDMVRMDFTIYIDGNSTLQITRATAQGVSYTGDVISNK